MRLSFITQFKIQILLTFNGCRKVLEKMPDSPVGKERLLSLYFVKVYLFLLSGGILNYAESYYLTALRIM